MRHGVLRLLLASSLAACTSPARPTSAPASPVAASPLASVPTPAPAEPPAPAPAPAPDAPPDSIRVRIAPTPTYVELGDHDQLVNCDLIVSNSAAVSWSLERLQVEVFDRHGELAIRKFLDGNGVSPSIRTVPNRELSANASVLVMNPLFRYPRDVELGRLRFTLTYARADGSEQEMIATTEVTPVVYANQARLQLPLRGRVLVWDGHDFLAHHRRWDYLAAPIRALGFTTNAGRYSYDLVHVDEHGAMLTGDPAKNESWRSFGQPIYAPAAGAVVAVVDQHADDRTIDMERLKTELLGVYGNYVIIDHGRGEHSVFGHIRQGSAKVKVGDRVRAGQLVAAVGASGSSLMPHLHYQLQTTATAAAEGLPSYFHDFVRVRGRAKAKVLRGQIDSGDIVERSAR